MPSPAEPDTPPPAPAPQGPDAPVLPGADSAPPGAAGAPGDDAATSRTARRELAATGFFRLWTGESASLVGSQVTLFALPLVAVLVLDASAWEMGLLGAAGSLAVLLFGPSIGAWVDRMDRRSAMQTANVLRCLLLLLVPAAYLLDALHLWLLLLVAFAVGGLSLLFDTAMAGYVPALVGRRLVAANSWMQSTVSVSDTAGPGLAGALVQVLGAPLAILADAASYLVSMTALQRLPKAPPGEAEEEQTHFRAVAAGFLLVLRDRVQRPMMLAATHFNLFTAMFFAVYMLYLIKVLGFSPLAVGLLNVAGGLTGLLGAWISSRVAERFGYGTVLTVVYAIPGVAALLVPAAQLFDGPLPAVLVGASTALWSFSVTVNLILSETIKQALVPSGMLGRVTSVIRVTSWGVEPVGSLLGGAIASSALGLRYTLVLAGAGVFTSMFWTLFSRVRSLRVLPEEPVGDLAVEQGEEQRESYGLAKER
ncbi:MFS transporter [Streptomyces marispadix]|uniref:MFS transporter n=1 Tax=Streptomyces marispadix TaxID=2922868 RepID=A0ABS9SZB3_9ACTN|nr:MFS transporter [Streptomyces marispadix]MCH6161604.1 MFS transporter [Streptomyces marispadix]